MRLDAVVTAGVGAGACRYEHGLTQLVIEVIDNGAEHSAEHDESHVQVVSLTRGPRDPSGLAVAKKIVEEHGTITVTVIQPVGLLLRCSCRFMTRL